MAGEGQLFPPVGDERWEKEKAIDKTVAVELEEETGKEAKLIVLRLT